MFELEIKDTTESILSATYLDCYLCVDNGKVVTKPYDKRDDFNFSMTNFPFLSSHILSAPAYGVKTHFFPVLRVPPLNDGFQ